TQLDPRLLFERRLPAHSSDAVSARRWANLDALRPVPERVEWRLCAGAGGGLPKGSVQLVQVRFGDGLPSARGAQAASSVRRRDYFGWASSVRSPVVGIGSSTG